MVCVIFPDLLLCSSLFLAELREVVSAAIPSIVECLKDSDSDVRNVAITGLSALGAHGLGHLPCLLLCSSFSVAELREVVGAAIPSIVECLKDSGSYVRIAAITGLSALGAHGSCHLP